ncbi:MAG TPA: S8 family serine peptidase [Sphingomicrobium sp.]|jgi:subtilisin family serine protease|nr:S8 family serine peptidase [Sphingomicrobium sp.]
MKAHIYLGGVAAASLLAVGTAAQAAPGDKIAGSYICVFNKGVSNPRAEAARAAHSAGGNVHHVYEHSIRGFSAAMSATAAAQLKSHNAAIAFCEQDQEVDAIQSSPFDFRELGKPGKGKPTPSQPNQTTPWGVARVHGGTGTGSGSGTAWVIDTGIDLDHPDLNVDTGRSANFVARESSPDDLNGHGSHVAGIIGARDNAVGVIGVSPGATLVAVRVLNRRGSGSNSDVIAGVDYVAANGHAGDVANMSLGGGVSEALDQAVVAAARDSGVKFTLAAGNESESATLHSPGRANGTNVYTVSSFAKGDTWSSFSNFDNPPVDFAEPGSSIPSTYKDGGYATLSGTSMAAPHLAGILLTSAPKSGGTVSGDPDGEADTIGTK